MCRNKKSYKRAILILISLSIGLGVIDNLYEKRIKAGLKNSKLVYADDSNEIGIKNNLIKTTKYGQIEGSVTDNNEVLSWTGIPYAKAPIGDLRWKEPKEPDNFEGIFDATKEANVGIQVSNEKIIGSEDCLNLNIYRPNTDDEDLPVLLFIHGGNNQTGTSVEVNAANIAKRTNSIVVSINYRLGALGFNNLPALKTGNEYEDSGNYTLLDINKSLDWINDNIKSFGGDSNNITVSGFSAGGRDVMAMLISPIFEGKFQKAISFSGGMTIADSEDSTKIVAKAIAPLVVEDKVKSTEQEAYNWLLTDDTEVKDYLYGLSADRIASLMGNAEIRMSVFPHLYNDGNVIPEEGFETKKYNSVPLIMLTGSSEFSAFGRYDKYFKEIDDDTLLLDKEKNKEINFAIGYGSKMYEYFNAEESAEKMIDKYDAPIYTCDIDWGTDKDIVGENMAQLWGSYHGIFIPFLTGDITGTAAKYPDAFNNNGVHDLSEKFTKYISNFLWSSNPNGEGLVEWKPWTKNKESQAQLKLDADKEQALIDISYKHTSYDEIIKEMEEDNSISEEIKTKLIKEVLNGRWFSTELDKHFNY